MADPITREQVEWLLADTLAGGNAFSVFYRSPQRELAPAYVLGAWEEDGGLRDVMEPALTRWRDELAAAEPPAEAVTPRPVVQRFALLMEEVLRANDHKPGWEEDEHGDLMTRLEQETTELRELISAHPWDVPSRHLPDEVRQRILREAADVANFALMVADVTEWRIGSKRALVAAAEPVRRVARWVPQDGVQFVLSPPYMNADGEKWYVTTREQAIAWGYEIEGGPEPVAPKLSPCPDCGGPRTDMDEHDAWCDDCWGKRCQPAEDSPERLRERRDALGLSDQWARDVLGPAIPGAGLTDATDCQESKNDRLSAAEGRALDRGKVPYTSKSVEALRQAYAAALSAEESARAADRQASVARCTPPEPERPAPRFKVGDWVRHCMCVTPWPVDQVKWSHGQWWCHAPVGPHAFGLGGYRESDLEPASPPAPEVVDVPQPVVKRCACPDIHDAVEATWQPGEPYLTVTHTAVPLALLRAMLEAIDAQQGGAS